MCFVYVVREGALNLGRYVPALYPTCNFVVDMARPEWMKYVRRDMCTGVRHGPLNDEEVRDIVYSVPMTNRFFHLRLAEEFHRAIHLEDLDIVDPLIFESTKNCCGTVKDVLQKIVESDDEKSRCHDCWATVLNEYKWDSNSVICLAYHKKWDLVQQVLDIGDLSVIMGLASHTDGLYEALLKLASFVGNLEFVRKYAHHFSDKKGNAHVYCAACCGGHVNVVRFLHETWGMHLPLGVIAASTEGHIGVLKYLLEDHPVDCPVEVCKPYLAWHKFVPTKLQERMVALPCGSVFDYQSPFSEDYLKHVDSLGVETVRPMTIPTEALCLAVRHHQIETLQYFFETFTLEPTGMLYEFGRFFHTVKMQKEKPKPEHHDYTEVVGKANPWHEYINKLFAYYFDQRLDAKMNETLRYLKSQCVMPPSAVCFGLSDDCRVDTEKITGRALPDRYGVKSPRMIVHRKLCGNCEPLSNHAMEMKPVLWQIFRKFHVYDMEAVSYPISASCLRMSIYK